MSHHSPEGPVERLADFEIIRRLGVGGMAEVFLAKKRGAEGTYKLLVVKRVLPQYGSSRRFRAMFAEEAQLATRLNHPNIVQVYEFQDYGDEGQLLSMEYVEGPDLRKLMRAARTRGKRIPPFVGAFIVAEVAKGLHYAHERKDEDSAPLDIVHRDVSPQNVLLSYEGAVKIADFGIATANLFREEPGVLKGKTGYMSPEQSRGERVDRRSDIYSLGVVLHELLTGRPLHGAAEGNELLEAVRVGRVEPPSTYAREVPAELESIAMRALAPEPLDRFQTARDLAAAVTRALFQRQQIVDAHVLETVIAQLVTREHTSPGLHTVPPEGVSGSELGEHAGAQDSQLSGSRPEGSSDAGGAAKAGDRGLRHRAGREVRHVAVVRLRIHGLNELEAALGPGPAARFGEMLRGILDEMAFKRGARWSWQSEREVAEGTRPIAATARAVVGLLENPARAASDATRLALDVHEAVRAAVYDFPISLRASVGVVRGIASGTRDRSGHLIQHTIHDPGEYLAELLGDGAPPGATWVAGGLYRLVRRDFVWGEVPALTIDEPVKRKLPQQLRIHALVRPLTREERAQAIAQARGDLIGRDSELAELQAAYHQAATPISGAHSRVVSRVVYGEMGIGKTALVQALLAEIPSDTLVLHSECSPAQSELPFANVAEWMRELTGLRQNQPLEDAKRVVGEGLGDVAPGHQSEEVVSRLAELVTGRVAAAADEGDVAHNRRLVGAGVRRYLANAAAAQPVVLVVDGLGWCDRQSLELVRELAHWSEPLRLLILLIARPEQRLAPFIEGLIRIELLGLSADNQIRLLQARLGATQGVAQVCVDLLPKAAGNPFFLLEMVDALLERGTLELRDLGDGSQQLVRIERPGQLGEPLPDTLEQLIADRLSELPPEEREIVDWLAVSGGPLSERDLSVLTAADCDDAVARLCARGLCDVKNDGIDVRYPLTRDVAYFGLEQEVRTRMHLALGEHLRQTPLARGLTAAIVGRHLARGGAKSAAADFYLEAAETARTSYQMRLSTRYHRRALDCLGETDLRRLGAHEALEGICRVQGRSRERRRHLIALRRLAKISGSPHWVARALLRTARFELDQGYLSRGLSSTQRAEQVARQAGSPVAEVQAQSLMAEMLRDLGDMQGALAACDRALATAANPAVPPPLRAEVLRARGTLLRRVGRVHEAVEAHAEAIAVFKQVGARRTEARAKNSLAFAMFVLGRFEDAIALALDAIRIDLAIGGRLQIAKTLSNIGQSYSRLGDLPRGLVYLKRAREAHERYGDQDSRADTLLATGEVLLEMGDLAAADTVLRDASALNAVSGSAYDSVHEKLLSALLARASGDASAAVMHAFDARQAAEAQAYVAYHFYAMAIEADARVDIGEQHTGILLATTALGAIQTIQGSEYGLETRAICCTALSKAGSPQADEMRGRAAEYARQILGFIREPYYRQAFLQRAVVRLVLGESANHPEEVGGAGPAPSSDAAADLFEALPVEIRGAIAGPTSEVSAARPTAPEVAPSAGVGAGASVADIPGTEPLDRESPGTDTAGTDSPDTESPGGSSAGTEPAGTDARGPESPGPESPGPEPPERDSPQPYATGKPPGSGDRI